jgi:hypothetical protein
MRNRLFTTLLRRRASSAFHALVRQVRLAWRDRSARAALREAISALPWILRERKPIPYDLEKRVRALDNRLTT